MKRRRYTHTRHKLSMRGVIGFFFYVYAILQRNVTNGIYYIYYMEESVLLGTKPLVDSIRHFIRDPSGVLSVCHLCECRIVQGRHDSRLLLLLNLVSI